MSVALYTFGLVGCLGLCVAANDGKAVTKSLTVKTVMETAPLQLTATAKTDGKDETYNVLLTDDTEVTRDGKKVKPGALVPGLSIQVQGKITGDKRLTATKIEIVEPKKK